jgi:Reverse transcriptase (RNA-dependent DNA polymerase)/gag-polypeptide of LTR copia-type
MTPKANGLNLRDIVQLESSINWHPWFDDIRDYLNLTDLEEFLEPVGTPTRERGESLEDFKTREKKHNTNLKYACVILRNRLGYTAKDIVKDYTEPHRMIKKLREHFKPKGSGLYTQLEQQLINIHADTFDSLAAYGAEIRKLHQQISEISPNLRHSDASIVQLYLQGLGDSYRHFRTSFLAAHDALECTLETVELAAINEEKTKARDFNPPVQALYASTTTNTISANANNLNKSTLQATNDPNYKLETIVRRVSWCTHCQKKFHKKDGCHKLHPELKEAFEKEKGNKRPRASTAEIQSKTAIVEEFIDYHGVMDYQASLNSTNNSGERLNLIDEWLLDSGCSNHITCHKKDFLKGTYQEFNHSPTIRGIGDTTLKPQGSGTVIINCQTNNKQVQLQLSNVLYCPEIGANLISLTQLLGKAQIQFSQSKAVITIPQGNILALNKGNVFLIQLHKPSEVTAMISTLQESKLQEWHEKMGHLGKRNIKLLANMTTGTNLTNEDIQTDPPGCFTCHLSNAKDTSHKKHHITPGKYEYDLIHVDIKGPLPRGLNGERYFVAIMEDYNKVSEVRCIDIKSKLMKVIKSYKLRHEHGHTTIRRIRLDNAGENSSTEFQTWCDENGIILEYSVPYSQQQNGTAEALIKLLMFKVRPMLHASGLEDKYWPEAVATANYLRNRSPCASIGMTPYEKSTGRKPNLSHLGTFGQKVTSRLGSQVHYDSLQTRAFPGRLLGYEGDRIYRILQAGKIIRATAVTLLTNNERGLATQLPTHQSFSKNLMNEEPDRTEDPDPAEGFPDELPESHSQSNSTAETQETPITPQQEQNIQFPPTEADPNERILRPRGERVPFDFKRRTTYKRPSFAMACIEQANATEPYEPKTYKEAIEHGSHKEWLKAMEDELDSLHENDVWKITTLPPDRTPLRGRWIFRYKRGPQGEILRYKARWVVKGYMQQEGIDFNETFASVVKPMSYKALLAIAAAQDLEIEQMDVKTAFLYGKLDEDIYVEQPTGFEDKDNTHGVCKLNRALYGLRQSPRVWYFTLSTYLKSIGFEPLHADLSVFIRDRVILAIYVDDLLIVGPDKEEIKHVKKQLGDRFQMSDLGQLSWYLGMHITRDRANRILRISQQAFFESLLKDSGLQDIKPADTPMNDKDLGTAPPNYVASSSLRTKYQSCVGSIMYGMMGTRADIAFPISVVSRYAANPTEAQWTAVQRILRYIKGTLDWELVFRGELRKLQGYSDADWAGDQETRRSTSGFIFNIGSGAISWSSKRQSTVALSTCEAEYLGQTQATKEAIFLRSLLQELRPEEQPSATIIYCDNQGAIALAKNPQFHARTKHIDIQHHFVREKVASGEVDLQYVPTEEQLADGLTKPLSKEKFFKFRALLGLEKRIAS